MNILDRLKKLSAQATPGPWAVNQDGAEEWWYSDTILGEGGAGGALASCTEGNAELIVTAINALPALIAVAEAAGEYADNPYTWNLDELKAALTALEVEQDG